jgi:hypothetical protein
MIGATNKLIIPHAFVLITDFPCHAILQVAE